MQFIQQDLHQKWHLPEFYYPFFIFFLILLSTPSISQQKLESDHNPVEWQKLLSEKGSILYKDYYTGVNLILSGNQNRLIANLILSPGSKLSDINLDFINAVNLQIGNENQAVVQFDNTVYSMKAPVFTQAVNGKKQESSGSYYIKEKNKIGIVI